MVAVIIIETIVLAVPTSIPGINSCKSRMENAFKYVMFPVDTTR